MRPVVAIACSSAEAEIYSVLATVLGGGCFVPLDERLPRATVDELLEDAQPDAIILSGPKVDGPRRLSAADYSSRRSVVIIELGESPGRQPMTIRTGARANTREEGPPAPFQGEHLPAATHRREGVHPRSRPSSSSIQVQAPNQGLDVPQRASEVSPSSGADGEGEHDGSGGETATTSSTPADDLLYIMYTSGSTGKPKGVRGTRSGAMERVRFGWSRFPFRDSRELVVR